MEDQSQTAFVGGYHRPFISDHHVSHLFAYVSAYEERKEQRESQILKD